MFASRRRFIELTTASVAFAATARAAEPASQWADLDSIQAVAEGFSGAEGPSVLPDGNVVFVAQPGSSIYRAVPGGESTILVGGLGTVVGTALDRKNKNILYVCRMDLSFMRRPPGMPPMPAPPGPPKPAGVLRLDLGTNQITQLISSGAGTTLQGPNKLVVDEWGDLWFTDVLAGMVYWAGSDGSGLKLATPLPGAHGICLSPNGRTIYIGADQGLVALTISGRGSLAMAGGSAQIKLVAPMDPKWRADGIATEAGGNIVVAGWDNGLFTISPEGEVVSQTKIPGFGATNLAFGGKDGRTLYLTVNLTGGGQGKPTGKLISIPWPRPGIRLATL